MGWQQTQTEEFILLPLSSMSRQWLCSCPTALANSASLAQGPYLRYPLVAASTWRFGVPRCRASSAGQRLRRLCDRAGSISGIAAARWGGLSWDPHELVALTNSAEARPRGPLGWEIQGGRAPQPPARGGGSAAWPWERGKGSGMGNEVLPFWWQCGITLAQKAG